MIFVLPRLHNTPKTNKQSLSAQIYLDKTVSYELLMISALSVIAVIPFAYANFPLAAPMGVPIQGKRNND